jgi:hypothetical protein
MTAECGKLRADGTFLKSLVVADFVPIHGLHHYAYRCRDAEETRSFYEEALGLPLTHLTEKEERNRGLRKV